MMEDSLPLGLAEVPVTFVHSSIWPLHSSLPMSEATLPLTRVSCSILIVLSLFDNFTLWPEHTIKSLLLFLLCEVLTLYFSSHEH
jgi:hypothetical protein